MLNNVDTTILVRELDKRLADWINDPDPVDDYFFSLLDKRTRKTVDNALQKSLTRYADQHVSAIIKSDPCLYSRYKEQLA